MIGQRYIECPKCKMDEVPSVFWEIGRTRSGEAIFSCPKCKHKFKYRQDRRAFQKTFMVS